jgi:hypothetical protein
VQLPDVRRHPLFEHLRCDVIHSRRFLLPPRDPSGRRVQGVLSIDLINQAEPLASFHAVIQRCQHAVCPDPGFGPLPAVPDVGLSDLLSLRHCRRLWFPVSCHSTSTSLPPFAPRELPRFNAPMRALTSAAPSSQTNALTGLRLSVLRLSGRPTIPSPITLLPCPCRQLDTTPTATGFHKTAPWQTVQVESYRHRFAVRVSPLASRLTGGLGRNGFALLRTGRSPPVASHLDWSSIPCRASDAVTFRFRPESVYLKRTHTSLTKQLHTRTSPCREAWVHRPSADQPRQGRQKPRIAVTRLLLSPLPGLGDSWQSKPHGLRHGLVRV